MSIVHIRLKFFASSLHTGTSHPMIYSNLHHCFYASMNVAIELLMVVVIVTVNMKKNVSEG